LRGLEESRSFSLERWEHSRFSSGFSCIFFSLVDGEIVVKMAGNFTDNFWIYQRTGRVI
jgi:hypothetical protein